MRGAGFRMGPCELLDLTGLDVSHPVMESIYDQYYQEPRYRPSPITRQRLAAGLLGRKSGRGFYTYADGKASPCRKKHDPALAGLHTGVGQPARSVPARTGAGAHRRPAAGTASTTAKRPAPTRCASCCPLATTPPAAALAEGLDRPPHAGRRPARPGPSTSPDDARPSPCRPYPRRRPGRPRPRRAAAHRRSTTAPASSPSACWR
jgi:hypothetical protein